MGEPYGQEDLQQVALAYERQRGSATSYRTSEITRQLELVKERRRIVESRAPYLAGGVLWAREISAQQERHRQAQEAARQRNRQLLEDVRNTAEEMRSQVSNPLRRASQAKVDAARKQYLDAVEVLYPQWCRQVEQAASESNQRLGNSLIDVQRKRALAAERFAKQMVAQTEIASKEQELTRARAVSHVENTERETKLRAAEAATYGQMGQAVIDAARVISALKENTPPGTSSRPLHVEQLSKDAVADSGIREGIDRLSAYLRQLSSTSEHEDPDMPPNHPPAAHETPSAPVFLGGRWGSPTQAGPGQHVSAQGLSAVPMEVYTPDGKQQTVMVPVLGASFAGPGRADRNGRMEVNPNLLKHMSTPKGGAATPVRRSADSTGSASFPPALRRDAPAAAAAKLKQQMPPSGQFPSRYQNNSADATPNTSVEVTPHTSLDWTGRDMPGDPDPVDSSSTLYQDCTLGDHVKAADSPGSDHGKSGGEINFSTTASTLAKETRTSSVRDSQEDSVVYTYAFQSPPPHKREADRASSRSSSPETSQEFSPTFPVTTASVAGSRRPSDQGGLSAEASAMSVAPSLMGMGGGTLSPASSQDAADWAVRSSVESRARSSHGKSPLGGNLGDSILSDLTEDTVDEEQLAEEREEWNEKERQRKESVNRELEQARMSRPKSPTSRPGTPVIQGAGASRSNRPLYRTNSSPTPTPSASQPSNARPSSSGGPQQQTRLSSGSKARPLGVFGFGGSLGGGGANKPPNISNAAATRGSGGSLMAMSSIVSKAFDDDGSESDGSDADGNAGSNFLRASATSVAPLPAARTSSFNPLSRSQSIGSHINETSDEFDF